MKPDAHDHEQTGPAEARCDSHRRDTDRESGRRSPPDPVRRQLIGGVALLPLLVAPLRRRDEPEPRIVWIGHI